MKQQVHSVILWGLLAGGIAACQESLTTPGGCPDLCPGGSPTVVDTVFDAVPDRDSAFRGYLLANQGGSFLVSSGLPGLEARGFVRFDRIPDSLLIGIVVQPFRIDSLDFTFAVQGRDSTVKNVWILMYRLPVTVDTTVSFEELTSFLTPDRLLDSFPIPDTLGVNVGIRVKGMDLARYAIPPADSGVLAVGFAVRGDGPLGVRLGSVVAGPTIGPQLRAFVTGTTTSESFVTTSLPDFSSYVFQDPPRAVVSEELVVGGVPSARALIRFQIPPFVRDSATLVRALLELDTAVPLDGLPNDPTQLDVRGVVGDFGAKSVSAATPVASNLLEAGTAGVVQVNVLPIVALWRGGNSPQSFFLQVAPEAGVFGSPVFRSTRSPVGRGPRLRITFVVPTNPERP